MTVLLVGMDEIATERQLVSGWTYFVLTEADRTAFESAIAGFAASGGLRHYHAKKFKKAMAPQYERFLEVVRRAIEHSTGYSCLIHTLNETAWKAQFMPFLKRVVAGSLSQNGISDPRLLRILQSLFPGLVTLQRLLVPNGSIYRLRVEIDQDDVTSALGITSVGVRGVTLQAERLLELLYEGHRKEQFPHSPSLNGPGSLTVLSDAKSSMVQAADVVGNFAMAYALHHLGDPSKSRAVKASVFANVFGDLLDPGAVTTAAVLQGNQMTWKQPGALTFRLEMK